jgi:CheY-like chemotaxis protein
MLERLGLHPNLAADGREAVQMFRSLQHDVIFMDCQMPELDGYEATRQIRRLEKPGQHVRIIAMTAEALAGARENCLAAGMDAYIPKPIRLGDLCEALEARVLFHAEATVFSGPTAPSVPIGSSRSWLP